MFCCLSILERTVCGTGQILSKYLLNGGNTRVQSPHREVVCQSVPPLMQNTSPSLGVAALSQTGHQSQCASIELLSFYSAFTLTDGLVQVTLCGKFIPSQSCSCQQREDNHFFLARFLTQSSVFKSSIVTTQPFQISSWSNQMLHL